MSKLKVWCDFCDGTGKDESGRNPTGDCTVCGGDGFTLREVVELPDGRAVVVSGGKVYEAGSVIAVDAWGIVTAGCLPQNHLYLNDGMVVKNGDVVTRIPGPFKAGDLIAVGLKEVGK